MSALTPAGSTRRWRQIRAAVLARDGRRCRYPFDAGVDCGRYAVTAGHIIARSEGGTDAMSNLRAECAEHNFRAGALLRRTRPAPAALTPAQHRLAALLDALAVPADAGRRTALRALAAAALRGWGRDVGPLRSCDVDKTCAWRRARAATLARSGSRW